MRAYIFAVAAASFAVMACDKPVAPEPAADDGTTTASVSDRPRPGTYAVKLTDEFIGNDAPDPSITESTRKFTADQFASQNWIASTLEGDQCRDRHLSIHDGSISGGMRCDMADLELVDQPVDLHGSDTSDGWDVTVDMTNEGHTYRRSVTLRRIGD